MPKIDIQCECSRTDWQHNFAIDNFIEEIRNIVKKYFCANCSRNNKQRTHFENGFFVTQCITIPGRGFRLGQFCCRCKEGYYNPEIKAPDSSKSVSSAHSCLNHHSKCFEFGWCDIVHITFLKGPTVLFVVEMSC